MLTMLIISLVVAILVDAAVMILVTIVRYEAAISLD